MLRECQSDETKRVSTSLKWSVSPLIIDPNNAIESMLYMVGILAAIDIVFWVGGYLLFRLAEKRTLKQGDLGAF